MRAGARRLRWRARLRTLLSTHDALNVTRKPWRAAARLFTRAPRLFHASGAFVHVSAAAKRANPSRTFWGKR